MRVPVLPAPQRTFAAAYDAVSRELVVHFKHDPAAAAFEVGTSKQQGDT